MLMRAALRANLPSGVSHQRYALSRLGQGRLCSSKDSGNENKQEDRKKWWQNSQQFYHYAMGAGNLIIGAAALGALYKGTDFVGKLLANKDFDNLGLVGVDTVTPESRVTQFELYRNAKKSVFISAMTGAMVFKEESDFNVLQEILKQGKHVKILLLAPDSPDITSKNPKLSKNAKEDIKRSIAVAKRKMKVFENLEVRVMERYPSFTVDIIDRELPQSLMRVTTTSSYQDWQGAPTFIVQRTQEQKDAYTYFSNLVEKEWNSAKDVRKI